jgi:hypothetical protein
VMRGEADQARAIALRSEALWRANDDRIALVCACLVHGMLERDQGRPALARDWLEKGIRAFDDLQASSSPAVFVADPGVIMRGLLANELLQLGRIEQGRRQLEAAVARAQALREPGPRQAAFWLEALFELRIGNPARVADAAERLAQVQNDYEAPEGKAAALWFRGWAEAQLGDPIAGHRLIRKGHEQVTRAGMRAYGGETLGYAAEALLLAGDPAGARVQIEEARHVATAVGDRSCLPRLLTIEARVADALGERRQARDALRQAIAEARTQELAWPELRAWLALCERGERTRADLAGLREVLGRLGEDLDALPVARARSLLGSGASASD